MAHPEYEISEHQLKQLNMALERYERGEPLPYVIGHWEFFGLDLLVSPDVLIPRPETELLVERALQWLKLHPRAREVADIGTGTGCIAISLATHLPDLQLLLTDISTAALDVARDNAARYNLMDRLDFLQADLLDGVIGTFDLVCANLPYIPCGMLTNLSVAHGEPRQALDGGKNGLVLITRLLEQAGNHLAADSLLLLEIEESQGNEAKSLAMDLYPRSKGELLQDLSGRDRLLEVESHSIILHICQPEAWQAAQDIGSYTSASLSVEGYIHCSTPEQILQVANLFYREIPDLVLLWINPQSLSSEIRWEYVGGAHFPCVWTNKSGSGHCRNQTNRRPRRGIPSHPASH
jgi:release factor glutamine methyltransferase